MKRLFLLLPFFVILMLSCKKKETPAEEEEIEPPAVPAKPADQILYTNYTPALSLQSVRIYSIFPQCTLYAPIPDDSIAKCLLDLNGDLQPDFEIRASHSRLHNDGAFCGSCEYYHPSEVKILALASGNSIAFKKGSAIPKSFAAADSVGTEESWQGSAMIFYEGCGGVNFSGSYLGVAVGKSYGYIKLEKADKNGIRILEHGLNKTDSHPIACGQKQ